MMSMSTKGSQSRTYRERTGRSANDGWVRLGTQVPPEVKEHYVKAASRHGVSLSLYFEMLSRVDPLAAGPLPKDEGGEQEDSENT